MDPAPLIWLTGINLTKISLPVCLFEPRSFLERVTANWVSVAYLALCLPACCAQSWHARDSSPPAQFTAMSPFDPEMFHAGHAESDACAHSTLRNSTLPLSLNFSHVELGTMLAKRV